MAKKEKRTKKKNKEKKELSLKPDLHKGMAVLFQRKSGDFDTKKGKGSYKRKKEKKVVQDD